MEEEKKICPSLPSNFVTLVQLQERWFKEKEQEQMEKENNLEKRKLEEEKGQQRKLQEEGEGGGQIIQKSKTGFRSANLYRNQFRRNNRKDLEVNRCWREVSHETCNKSQVEAGILEGNTEREKKSKKSKRKQKPSVEEEVEGSEGTKHAPLEEGKDETKNIDVRRRDEQVGRRSEFNPVIKNSIIRVERKFGDLSMKYENEKKSGRFTKPKNGHYRSHMVGHGYGQHGMVWVRKDGHSDGTLAGTETSGGVEEGPLLQQ
ncbi:hypothetical protein O6P43_019026 [Quillaja saponaria]|uniref:Uncharacterized protein n=1 Tax=Quillaja saponaria TaxID=32244 RepID=A0AAD7PJV2_QUISA|nr:hypothetical protein O6P43_019026 [Quillaja saponaria]